MSSIIDGKKIANEMIANLKKLNTPKKSLAVVLVGDDKATLGFIKEKEKVAKELGVDFELHTFSEKLSHDTLRNEIEQISGRSGCGGILVQLPLAPHMDRHFVLSAIPREKDIDVLGEEALGGFYSGRGLVLPPSVAVVNKILSEVHQVINGKRVAVVGLGFLVGRPVANWFMRKVKEMFLIEAGSDYRVLLQADLVISGVGKAGLIKAGMLKDGAGIIDFGVERVGVQLQGDFDCSGYCKNVDFYTPTPNGTGPILVAQLFDNFYKLNA